jgi:hypothetical protein
MDMLRFSMILAMILMLLNGCATYRNDNLERMQSLPQNYSQFDAKLAWEIKSTGSSTVIDGVIKNIRYYEMDDLEIWVWSLDDRGKEVHRAVDFVFRLMENEMAQFTVVLPKVASGTKLRFLYRYVGRDDGGEDGSALRWSQSFDAAVP